MSRGDGRKYSATVCCRPQVAEMSCYSVGWEITLLCADFLVELRGFEPRCSGRCSHVSAAIANGSIAITFDVKSPLIWSFQRLSGWKSSMGWRPAAVELAL